MPFTCIYSMKEKKSYARAGRTESYAQSRLAARTRKLDEAKAIGTCGSLPLSKSFTYGQYPVTNGDSNMIQ